MLLPALFILGLTLVVLKPFYKIIITGVDLLVNKRRFSEETLRIRESRTWCNVVRIQKCCHVYEGGRTHRRVLKTSYEVRFDTVASPALLESGVIRGRPYGFIDTLDWKSMSSEEDGHATWFEYSRPKIQTITVILKSGTHRADLEVVALVTTSLLKFKQHVLMGFATLVGLVTFLVSIVLLTVMKNLF